MSFLKLLTIFERYITTNIKSITMNLRMFKTVAGAVVLLLIVSCGTSKEVIGAKKTLKGEWTLNAISYDQAGTFEVTLFNDAAANCMEGSTWKFIPNNYSGKYVVNGNECVSTGPRNFLWTIPSADDSGNYSFMFKPVDAKKKSIDNKGFRMNLAYLDQTNMTWTQTVSLEGKPFMITMKFTKLQTN